MRLSGAEQAQIRIFFFLFNRIWYVLIAYRHKVLPVCFWFVSLCDLVWYLFYRRYLNQFERSDPPFAFSYGQLRAFRDLIKTYNEHVYAPRLNAFKQGWDSAKMVSRVARVCKVRKSCFCKHCSDVYDNNDLLKSCVAKIVGDREAA